MRFHLPKAHVFALLAVTALASSSGAAAAPPPWAKGDKEKDCKTKEEFVKGQGVSCRVDGGLWKVRLRGGQSLLTHGPDDPKPAGEVSLAATPRLVKCPSANPNGSYYMTAIVAWPAGKTPNETDASYRSRIQNANGLLYDDAVLSGSPNGVDYVFACDGAGQIRVDRVQLPTSAASATFSSIVSDLKALGYDNTNEKYVVWYDDATIPYCGEGSFWGDERDSVSNYNNSGPDYAVSYDCDAIMHENGHNIGAVQYNAPFSTGSGGHCWQEYDIMCYADGGDRARALVYACTDRNHFDCGFNDYFDAKIGAGAGSAAGSYLDTNWNIGECYNRWIVNYVCGSPPTGSYRSTVLSQSPLAYWRLGETGGITAADESGNGNSATYSGGVTLGAAGAIAADANTAASFDGMNDYARAPNAPALNPASGLTLEAWVKPSHSVADFQKPIIVKSYTSHNPPYYSYGMFITDRSANPKRVAFHLSLGGTWTYLLADNTGWQYGVWNHVAATYDGAAMRVYVNGREVGSKAASGSIVSYVTPLTIGAYENLPKNSPYLYKGELDEPAVYGRALTATELTGHHVAGIPIAVTYRSTVLSHNPIGYYRLGETSGSVAFEEVAARHGSYQSGVTLGAQGALVGDASTAARLDGSDDNVSLTNLPVNTAPGGKNTVELWMYWNGQELDMPFGFATYDLFFWGGGIGFNTANSDLYGTSSAGLSNRWVHVVAVFTNGDARQNRLYLNGVAQTLTQRLGQPTARNATTTARIGRWGESGGYNFGGSLDEVSIYARELSSAEVTSHYTRGLGQG